MDNTELANLLTNEILLVVAGMCGLVVWVIRHHAQNHERLSENHFNQYNQFQDEIPRLRTALESIAKIAPIIEELQGHLKDMDSEHHGIIETHLSEITLLKDQIGGLQKELNGTQNDLADTKSRLVVCEATRTMMAKFLKKNDPELYGELKAVIDSTLA